MCGGALFQGAASGATLQGCTHSTALPLQLMAEQRTDPARLRAQIRDLETALRDLPPHSGATDAGDLRTRIARLRRRLRDLEGR